MTACATLVTMLAARAAASPEKGTQGADGGGSRWTGFQFSAGIEVLRRPSALRATWAPCWTLCRPPLTGTRGRRTRQGPACDNLDRHIRAAEGDQVRTAKP